MGLQEKFEELINEAEVDIPKSNIDRASASYVIDLKKTKKKTSSYSKIHNIQEYHSLLHRTKKLKNAVKLHVDLSKKRFTLLFDAEKYDENVVEIQLFVYADLNCNSRVEFHSNEKK